MISAADAIRDPQFNLILSLEGRPNTYLPEIQMGDVQARS